jgi:uncharacterized protein YbaR (Trm112 family)
MLNKKILHVLVCPLCKGRLVYEPHHAQLVCHLDHLAYPIKKGIPVLIPEKAIKLNGE